MSGARQRDHQSAPSRRSPEPAKKNHVQTTFTKLPHPTDQVHVYRPSTAYEPGCDYTVSSIGKLQEQERRDYRNQDFGLFPAKPVVKDLARFLEQEVFAVARREKSIFVQRYGDVNRSAEITVEKPVNYFDFLRGYVTEDEESVSHQTEPEEDSGDRAADPSRGDGCADQHNGGGDDASRHAAGVQDDSEEAQRV